MCHPSARPLPTHPWETVQTYHLKLILPKLLFLRLIEEGEIPDMMHEDIS